MWLTRVKSLSRRVRETIVKLRLIAALILLLSVAPLSRAQSAWQQKLAQELPLMGHRNWIVIVDSAYPLQTSSGVETIETNADQLAVLDSVLHSIKTSPHIRPIIHLDRELQFIPESEAPGVERYRTDLNTRIAAFHPDSVLHQELIDRLADTGKTFHVLVLKTRMTIPYTSVFLQLDCRYWSAESEARLREAMKTP
jgi:L-fucose mutarotase/ribose pyranase (RbsD/FucU family)